jgi:hypothetical protein
MAEFGERDSASGPFDDRTSDDRLDPAYVLAHGRLRDVQDRRRAVKSATVGYRRDAAQRGDVEHLGHGPKVLRSVETIKETRSGRDLAHFSHRPIAVGDRSRSPIFVGPGRTLGPTMGR